MIVRHQDQGPGGVVRTVEYDGTPEELAALGLLPKNLGTAVPATAPSLVPPPMPPVTLLEPEPPEEEPPEAAPVRARPPNRDPSTAAAVVRPTAVEQQPLPAVPIAGGEPSPDMPPIVKALWTFFHNLNGLQKVYFRVLCDLGNFTSADGISSVVKSKRPSALPNPYPAKSVSGSVTRARGLIATRSLPLTFEEIVEYKGDTFALTPLATQVAKTVLPSLKGLLEVYGPLLDRVRDRGASSTHHQVRRDVTETSADSLEEDITVRNPRPRSAQRGTGEGRRRS